MIEGERERVSEEVIEKDREKEYLLAGETARIIEFGFFINSMHISLICVSISAG